MKNYNKLTSLALTLAGLAFFVSSAAAATVVWQGGTSAFNGTNWEVDTVADQSHPGINGNTTTISSGTVTDFTNAIVGNIGGIDTSLLIDGGAISGDFLTATTSNHASDINLASGSITMSSLNSFRSDNVDFAGLINFTGAAGSAFVAQTDLTGTTNQRLAGKIGASTGNAFSFFAIDGNMVASGVAYDGSNLSAVNTALAAQVFNDRYFEIIESGGTQTLTLAAIPEPSSFALLGGLGILALLRRRR